MSDYRPEMTDLPQLQLVLVEEPVQPEPLWIDPEELPWEPPGSGSDDPPN
jgi:hypothetical protein